MHWFAPCGALTLTVSRQEGHPLRSNCSLIPRDSLTEQIEEDFEVSADPGKVPSNEIVVLVLHVAVGRQTETDRQADAPTTDNGHTYNVVHNTRRRGVCRVALL